MKWTRIASLTLAAALLLGACGSDEMTLTEYVERVDAIFERGLQRYEVLVASPEGMVLIVGQGAHLGFDTGGASLTDFTPRDLHVALVQVAEIQEEALASAAEIDPPDQVAELHELYFRELPIWPLADRAEAAATWEELSETPEMEAYRNALAADNEACAEFQSRLDATEQRGAFADLPWMPSELTEIVDYALGCASLPQNPQDAFRP